MGASWEEVTRPPEKLEHIEAEDIDIMVQGGYIYVSTSHQVTLKVFTILGQTVAQATLAPGNHRLRLPAKGIYILKLGSVTRRITA